MIIQLPEGVHLQNLLWEVFNCGRAHQKARGEGNDDAAEHFEFRAKDFMRVLTGNLKAAPGIDGEAARLRAGLLAIGREARDGNTLAHVGLIVGLESDDYKALLREVAARGRECQP